VLARRKVEKGIIEFLDVGRQRGRQVRTRPGAHLVLSGNSGAAQGRERDVVGRDQAAIGHRAMRHIANKGRWQLRIGQFRLQCCEVCPLRGKYFSSFFSPSILFFINFRRSPCARVLPAHPLAASTYAHESRAQSVN
jgi:hypothetical protein